MKPTTPKHTPEPWTLDKLPAQLLRSGVWQRRIFTPETGTYLYAQGPDALTCEANARLIAAAPELLDSPGANTRLLQLVAPLLRDGPHVAKIKFLEEQIALNSALISKAGGNP